MIWLMVEDKSFKLSLLVVTLGFEISSVTLMTPPSAYRDDDPCQLNTVADLLFSLVFQIVNNNSPKQLSN